ncbi:MAG TPA: sarcosine oxidase subunit gamma family protein [Stellaceae bacterium]|nr:sarcosine oxidase subunit gamma family protein [Stellaceae bacterium]
MAEPTVLRALPAPLLLNLRGDAQAEAFRSAVAGVLGVALPVEPNTVAASGDIEILWLGPDEWLVVRSANHTGLSDQLDAALAGLHHSVIDVSQGRVVLELEGPEARAVLAQAASLDLRARAFGPGQCAQTPLARVPVILQGIDAPPRLRVFVRASFAPYVTEWLQSTIAELA